MTLPFYVAPEQMVQDKAEYARKGIAKGKSSIALEYSGGILLVADNPSASLHKISEVYDNIAFAGAGKYSEYENLRKAGIRHADMKGYAYGREDVTAKSLANAYSQAIGDIFSHEIKPLEVEILVLEVGSGDQPNGLYRISFDGSITDEKGFASVGGPEEEIRKFLATAYGPGLTLAEAFALAGRALDTATRQTVARETLEVAVLDRARAGRKFRRLGAAELRALASEP